MLLSAFITLMICSTCFGHLYAYHQELTIIYHCSQHGTSASWVLMVVRCRLAGCVAGLAATAVASYCCGLAGCVAGLAATIHYISSKILNI
jgi:hypothetical protein